MTFVDWFFISAVIAYLPVVGFVIGQRECNVWPR